VLRTLVFRDDDDEFILRAQDLIDADAVQIHGPLSDELRGRLREREVRVIKALSIASDEFYEFNDATVDAVLVDGATPGSGEGHSWEALSERSFGVPVIGAGDLATRMSRASFDRPTSGRRQRQRRRVVPGVKDRELMNHFVASAVGAFEDRVAS